MGVNKDSSVRGIRQEHFSAERRSGCSSRYAMPGIPAATIMSQFSSSSNLRSIPDGSVQVVVFDCDGVLFDSKEANILFYNHILERFELPPIRPEQVEYIHMHSARESLQLLFGDPDLFDAAWSYCQQMDFRQFHDHLTCQPGLREFLEALRPSYRIAMATNRTVSTPEVLRQFKLDQYFELVVTAADVRFPKPHPESMERILKVFSVNPDQVLYIGDSPVDEGLAMATDVFFAAYRNPKLKAHFHIEHFRELYPILFK